MKCPQPCSAPTAPSAAPGLKSPPTPTAHQDAPRQEAGSAEGGPVLPSQVGGPLQTPRRLREVGKAIQVRPQGTRGPLMEKDQDFREWVGPRQDPPKRRSGKAYQLPGGRQGAAGRLDRARIPGSSTSREDTDAFWGPLGVRSARTARHCPLQPPSPADGDSRFPISQMEPLRPRGAVTGSALCSGFSTRVPGLTGEASERPRASDPALSKILRALLLTAWGGEGRPPGGEARGG